MTYDGFASPHDNLDENLFRLIAIEYVREAMKHFLEQHSPQVDLAGNLRQVLACVFDSEELSFEDVWCPAIGECMDSIRSGDQEAPILAATAVALHLSFPW